MSEPTHEMPEASKAAESKPVHGVEGLVNGVPVIAPPDWKAVVRRAIREANAPLPPEMTVTQAADFLGVSRSYIIKLIRCGELPCRMVKKRRRIPTAGLEEHKEKMFQRAKAAMDEITQISQDLGLYDDLLPKKGQCICQVRPLPSRSATFRQGGGR